MSVCRERVKLGHNLRKEKIVLLKNEMCVHLYTYIQGFPQKSPVVLASLDSPNRVLSDFAKL